MCSVCKTPRYTNSQRVETRLTTLSEKTLAAMKLFAGKQRDDDLVTLARFTSSTSAHSLRILIEAHGIRVSVTNEESTSNLGTSMFGSHSPVGIEVSVFRRDLKEARTIMNEVPAASELLVPEWTCSDCGETVDQGFSVCWSCGGEFQ